MLDVHIHGGGPSGGGDGPAGLDGIGARIQGDDLVFIFDIVVDHPLAISDGILGAAAHGDCCYNRLRGRVYHSGVTAFTIHREDVFRSRLVKDAIRIAPRVDVARNF